MAEQREIGTIRLGSEEAGWLELSPNGKQQWYDAKPFTGINFTGTGEDSRMEMESWNGEHWIPAEL